MTWLILGGIFWIACGVEAYAREFAYSQREYPIGAAEWRQSDRIHALHVGAWGPFGLFACWRLDGFKHGRKWK